MKISKTAYVDKHAVIYGDVTIGDGSSVWPNASLRGDMASISIGENTSIQDNVVIHTNEKNKTEIGNNVTIGHGAILHCCKVFDNCIIGMGSIVMDGATVEENCIIGAGAVVTPGKTIPAKSLVMGVPGKIVRNLTDEEILMIKNNAAEYVLLAKKYLKK